MHVDFRAVRVAALAALFLHAPAFAASLKQSHKVVQGEVIVKFKPGTNANDISGAAHAAGADENEHLATVRSGVIRRMRANSKNVDALIAALERNPNVVYAEPNFLIELTDAPNDPEYPKLWGLENVGQTVNGYAGAPGIDINAEAAWNVTTGSREIVVGVIDTGVDYNHPDLAANMWSNPGGAGNDACAAGTHGFNAITDSCDPMDYDYHGTHVAGTIGAAGNDGTGIAGVNWTTSIMAIKFLTSSGGTTANGIKAIDFAVQAKIDGVNVRVLNNSWGGGAFSKALLDEILEANEHGILFVASAGNNGTSTDSFPHFPSSYAAPNVISVAALTNRGSLVSYSNYGPTTVHLGAPGVDVYSSIPGGSYGYSSGTSMAAPHVSGAAALILASDPSMTTAGVKSAILDNTAPLGSLEGRTTTGGMLDVAKALGIDTSAGFRLSISPSLQSIVRGELAVYDVTIVRDAGFSDPVDLTVIGLPAGVTGSFHPNPATTSSTLTVTTLETASYGTARFAILGTSGERVSSNAADLFIGTVATTIPCASFSVPAYYDGSWGATAVAASDFDRDGDVDLAVVNPAVNAFTIWKGTGNGTVTLGATYQSGSAPIAIAAADFNRDGRPDLATARSGTGTVAIHIGDGDGTFREGAEYGAGASPFWIATGDFDRDGRVDLAVASNASGSVSILRGNGDGTFAAPVSYSVGSGPYWVTATELDGDGNLDLVVAVFNADQVVALLGNGDGSFQAPTLLDDATGPSSIASGDLDGDGWTDLVVAGYRSNDARVLLSNGDGTFQPAVAYAVASNPTSVALADFDENGTLDLFVGHANSTTLIRMPGNGDGTFGAAASWTLSSSVNHVIAADLDENAAEDVVAVLANGDTAAILNYGACELNCGTFPPALEHVTGTSPVSVVAADFDRDGNVDVAVAAAGSSSAAVSFGNGDGSFAAAVHHPVGGAPAAIAGGDFNRDGITDLAVAKDASNEVTVLLGNADGTFAGAAGGSVAGTSPSAIASGDLDRDGNPDIIIADDASNDVSVLLGNGDGTFASATAFAVGTAPEALAIGDLDRDGIPDLVVANRGSNDVSLLSGVGDGTFRSATSTAVGTGPSAIVIADLDDDGRPDVAVANRGSDDVAVLFGNGGGFEAPAYFAAGDAPSGLATGDFDDDGDLDLAVTNQSANTMTLLFGDGTGQFPGIFTSVTGSGPAAVTTAHLDRDGKPDLIVPNETGGTVSFFRNACPEQDLVVAKTHLGDFSQGQHDAAYSITVTNAGSAATNGMVLVSDALPRGLSPVSLEGDGWICSEVTVTCLRTDPLGAASSYPPITLIARVAAGAPLSVENLVTVEGGGELRTDNNSAADLADVAPRTDMTVSMAHVTSFTRGVSGRTYTIVASNIGSAPSSGTVTLSASLGAGLTATAIHGPGWTCDAGSLTCTRSDVLGGGASFPPVTLVVDVASDAPFQVTSSATVAGGGDVDPSNNTSTDVATIWGSDGCGSFGARADYSTGYDPRGIVRSDLNGDGFDDLVLAEYGSGGVRVFLGNGDGTFTHHVVGIPGDTPLFALADFDGDGIPDIVVANRYPRSVAIWLGDGTGSFMNAYGFVPSFEASSIATADFDRDGDIDVALGHVYTSQVWILEGLGNGALKEAEPVSIVSGASSLLAADFDGDGFPDLAVLKSGTVWIHRGAGNLAFLPGIENSFLASLTAFALGDFDEDGNLDIAAQGGDRATILLGNGDGTLNVAGSYAYGTTSASALTVGDLNGDGHEDIAVAARFSVDFHFLLGNGDGTFVVTRFSDSSLNPTSLVLGDFDRDGRTDLAATARYGVSVYTAACSDLVVSKTHVDDFVSGQTNAKYTLRVTNNGLGFAIGPITVTDDVPSGLVPVSMSGYGWSCDLAARRCVRHDSLAPGASFPDITFTVNVSTSAPPSVTNVARVTGGGESDTTNNSAADETRIVIGPDLTIQLSHSGVFAPGSGQSYSIVVRNGGSTASVGLVSVVDSIPAGMSISSMSGSGWACSAFTGTCTRINALAPGASYPTITVMVYVNDGCPASVTNVATVSGGGDVKPANNSANDPTTVLTAPANLVATTVSTTQVRVTWSAVAGATHYDVLRGSSDAAMVPIAQAYGTLYNDASLTSVKTYVYSVRAAYGTKVGPLSARDTATTVSFTDDPLVPGVTQVKAVHLTELREAVNAMRAAAGLSAFAFSSGAGPGLPVNAIHVIELRAALDAARAKFFLPPSVSTTPAAGPGAVVRAAHIQEIRDGLK